MTSGTTASTAWPLLRQDYFQVYRLQRSVPEMAVANARMHLKPLVRIAQSADTFRSSASRVTPVRLFEGNRDALGRSNCTTVCGHSPTPWARPHREGSKWVSPGLWPLSNAATRCSGAGSGGKQAEIDQDRDRYFAK